MCLLVVCEPNATPNKDQLHKGACANPHGYGFAIHTGTEIIVERSMSAKKSIARFLELRAQYPQGYAMWHARYATHGVKNEQNCHPFMVGGDSRTYLAHNGVLDVSIHKSDKRSDTRVFAEDILPMLGGVSKLDDDNIWLIISGWASGSKIAVMTTDPTAQHPIYIINEELGEWDNDGVWWSNKSYANPSLANPTTYTPAVVSNAWELDKYDDGVLVFDDYDKVYREAERRAYDMYGDTDIAKDSIEDCIFCAMPVFIDDNPYFCPNCNSCFDCGTYLDECMCYTPPRYKSQRDLAHLYREDF